MAMSLRCKSWSRRVPTSRENHRETEDGGEPGEMPKSPGCETERERKAEVHQWAHVPCSLEQSRKMLEGKGDRGPFWTIALRRPNKEKARP